MSFRIIPLHQLVVNPSNDRHGEMRDENAAIDELFRLHDVRMRALTRDIVAEGRIFDPPLVMLHDGDYVVFDGNRRVTCMKLLANADRAPNNELVQFFRNQRQEWSGRFPASLSCQVETDRDVVDDILFRRHTGSQGGVGQIDWDDRAKSNFVDRTGKGERVNLSASVEEFLRSEQRLPTERIPWSTLTRLLSSEHFRGRVGISTANQTFQLTHERDAVLDALSRIAQDLAQGHLTLGHLWNNEGKRRYLDQLEADGLLPTEQHRLAIPNAATTQRQTRRGPGRPQRRVPATRTLIPPGTPTPQWTADQQRLSRIWDELASLPMASYPNAVSALLRMLVELTVEAYIQTHGLADASDLSRRVRIVAASLRDRDLIDERYFEEIERIRRDDALISIASMQRLLHSPDFAPMATEFRTYWTRLGRFLIRALSL